ncbi:MAG: DUF2470 domain-containing protein [Pseudomonadota bacterium]
MTTKDVLQTVDDAARRAARTFLRSARHGALATIDPKTGTPMASRVSLASAPDGSPVFLISQLSGHFGALEADPRASLMLGEPGRGDPLAHARITVYGTATKAEGEERAMLRARFLARQPKAALYADFTDFAFWRLSLEGASYNGGYGKAYEMVADDLVSPTDPDLIAMEPGAVAHMNDDHVDALELYATALAGAAEAKWRIASLDLEGMDLTAGDAVTRVWFEPPLRKAADLRPRLVAMAKRARETLDGAGDSASEPTSAADSPT